MPVGEALVRGEEILVSGAEVFREIPNFIEERSIPNFRRSWMHISGNVGIAPHRDEEFDPSRWGWTSI